MQEAPALTLYSNRFGHLLRVILTTLLLVTPGVSLLFGGSKNNPLQEILGVISLVIAGGLLLYSLYYLVTPIPLLCLDRTAFSYQRFPLIVRRIRWENIEHISAIREGDKRRDKSKQLPHLVVKNSIKPEVILAHKGPHEFSYTLLYKDLIVSPEKLVEFIRRFHTVSYQDLFA
jgi:hypothetical protein